MLLRGRNSRKFLFSVFSIAQTPDRSTGGLIEVGAADVGVTVIEVALASVSTVALGSAPKAGVPAEILVAAFVVASG